MPRLVEKHEPARNVDLLRPAGARAGLFGPLEPTLQGLGPLVVNAGSVRVQVGPHGRVAVARLVVDEPAEAPAPAQRGLRADLVRELHVAAIRLPQICAVRRDLATREQQACAEALADVTVHYDRQVGHTCLDACRAAERAGRVATRCRV